jgi:hypothetical protein
MKYDAILWKKKSKGSIAHLFIRRGTREAHHQPVATIRRTISAPMRDMPLVISAIRDLSKLQRKGYLIHRIVMGVKRRPSMTLSDLRQTHKLNKQQCSIRKDGRIDLWSEGDIFGKSGCSSTHSRE